MAAWEESRSCRVGVIGINEKVASRGKLLKGLTRRVVARLEDGTLTDLMVFFYPWRVQNVPRDTHIVGIST
jgi:hypothetical protein